MSISRVCSYQTTVPRFECKDQNTSKKTYLDNLVTKIQDLLARIFNYLKGILCCRSSAQQSRLDSKSRVVDLSKPGQDNSSHRKNVVVPTGSSQIISKSRVIDLSKSGQNDFSDLKFVDVSTTAKKTVDRTTSQKVFKLEKVPSVLFPTIASYLVNEDVLSLELVSKTCRQFVNKEGTWKKLLARDCGIITAPFTKAVYIEKASIEPKVRLWVEIHYGERSGRKKKKCEDITNYILEVFKDPAYQKDPQAYVRGWIVDRGHTEESRYLEDPALRYFRNNILKDNSH